MQFEARGFSLLPRQPVTSLLSGRHASRLRGRGLMFEELRDYRPGDDIRSIDWRATARRGKPHVRVNNEERERPVLLVVDQRSTMFFGSARTTKATAAAELTALAAWRTLDVGDRVGAIIFSDEEIVQIKPHRSRGNVLRICDNLVRINNRLSEDRTSDGSATRRLTTHLAAHNDVLAVLVYDPLGARLPVQGRMEATDGRRQLAIPEGRSFAHRYEAGFRTRCGQIRNRLRAIRVPVLPICTHDPVTQQVLSALGTRR
ncbi:MAG: DUF58 domain-containing protein [Fuerstiella sp.]